MRVLLISLSLLLIVRVLSRRARPFETPIECVALDRESLAGAASPRWNMPSATSAGDLDPLRFALPNARVERSDRAARDHRARASTARASAVMAVVALLRTLRA